jgi:Fe-S-cluster-containing dehydrogenase component
MGGSESKLSRRGFLRTVAAGAALALGAAPEAASAAADEVGLLIDTTQCKYCMRCVDACAVRHGGTYPGTFYTDVSLTYPLGQSASPLPIPFHCLHCADAPCTKVCQGGALQRTALGAVTFDSARCVGCLSCTSTCPFEGTIHYQATASPERIFKCDLCYDRLAAGSVPACFQACQEAGHDALIYGPADQILYEGQKRAAAVDGILLYPGETHTLMLFRKQEMNQALLWDLHHLTVSYQGSARTKAAIVRNARWGWIPVGAGFVYQVVRWRRDAIGRIGRDKTPPDKGD